MVFGAGRLQRQCVGRSEQPWAGPCLKPVGGGLLDAQLGRPSPWGNLSSSFPVPVPQTTLTPLVSRYRQKCQHHGGPFIPEMGAATGRGLGQDVCILTQTIGQQGGSARGTPAGDHRGCPVSLISMAQTSGEGSRASLPSCLQLVTRTGCLLSGSWYPLLNEKITGLTPPQCSSSALPGPLGALFTVAV